jgi:hypothetical protein
MLRAAFVAKKQCFLAIGDHNPQRMLQNDVAHGVLLLASIPKPAVDHRGEQVGTLSGSQGKRTLKQECSGVRLRSRCRSPECGSLKPGGFNLPNW